MAAVSTPPPRPTIDFCTGLPDLAAFPRQAWLGALRRALAQVPDAQLGYGDPAGAPELRRAVAGHLGRVRGLMASPHDVVIVNGCAQGFVLIGQVLRARGVASLAIEDPGSPAVRQQLSSILPLVPVRADGAGIDVTALAATGAAAILVTPAHHYPLGGVLPPDRRTALLRWTDDVDGLVVEDDYDAEFRYDHAPIGALQGLAPQRVVHLGSVSKTLAPGLRLGWIVAPHHLVADLVDAKRLDDLHTPIIDQLALAHLVTSGGYDRHIRRSRLAHRRRRDTLAGAVARYLPGSHLTGISAGVHAVIELPPATDEARVVSAAAASGVAVRPLGSCRWHPGGPPGLVMGFGHLTPDDIERGVRRLAGAIDGL